MIYPKLGVTLIEVRQQLACLEYPALLWFPPMDDSEAFAFKGVVETVILNFEFRSFCHHLLTPVSNTRR